MAFIQLTSPLILAGDPTLPNHPATKQYVDAKANNINAAGFSAGVLNVMRLPAFTGDVTMAAGSGNLVLSPTGVTPGTYPKVTMDSRGRALSGGALTADDIPSISWTKIVTGRPTTLAGYGLSSVIGLGGGTITGQLATTATPSAALHLVPKSYVDAMIQPSGNSLTTGDVVRKGYTATPSGFLRANGSKVSKVTYAALYNQIGDRYQVILSQGSEKPWLHLAGIGRTGSFTYSGTEISITANINYDHIVGSFVTKNRVYFVTAGNSGGYSTQAFKYCVINADGSLGPMQNNAFLASGMTGNTYIFFTTKNKMWCGTGGKLFYATINSDGSVTDFTLFSTVSWLQNSTKVLRVKNRLYYFDINFSGSSGPMEFGYSTLDANDVPGNLSGLGNIDASISRGKIFDAFVKGNKIYVITFTETNITNGVTYTVRPYYASINSDGTLSTWTAAPTFTFNAYGTQPTFPSRTFVLDTKNTVQLVRFTWSQIDVGTDYAQTAQAITFNEMIMDANDVLVSWSGASVVEPFTTYYNGSFNPLLGKFIVANRLYFPGDGYNNQSARLRYFEFSAGLNDYSPYYDGTFLSADPLNFYLPDFTSKETYNTRYFIKT